MLAIPADAFPGKLGGVAVKLGTEGTFDGPIVRDIQLCTGGVMKAGRLRTVAGGQPVI